MLGDFGIYFKGNMYNGSIRVPLMISYPGVIPAGTVSDAPAGLQDVLPTLLSLISSPMETENGEIIYRSGDTPERRSTRIDGIDLTDGLTGRGTGRDIYISQTFDAPNQQYMAASREFKYIVREMGGYEELYDQRNDIHELNNLIADPSCAEVLSQLRGVLHDWCKENDLAMIDGGHFAESPQRYDLTKKERHNLYGRRHY
jgi:arylsulfatase A-like enzyme